MKDESGVFLGLGSNIGNRQGNIDEALRLCGLKILHRSSLYETEPVGYLNQPWFLNCVVEVETNLQPHELLRLCQSVEKVLLREREIPKGPRTIDLDILFYGNVIHQDPDLKIPHPAIPERKFVLEPLNEIAPDFIHPVLQKTVSQLLAECLDDSAVRVFKD